MKIIMKKNILFFICGLICCWGNIWATDTVRVLEAGVPILIERTDNVLFYLRVDGKAGKLMNGVKLKFGDEVDLSKIAAVKLYYSGTKRLHPEERNVMRIMQYVPSNVPGKTLAAHPSYSVLKAIIKQPGQEVKLMCEQPLFSGPDFYWIAIQMKPNTPLDTKISIFLEEAYIDQQPSTVLYLSKKGSVHRMGVGVRHAGDDGSASFRIPGLVTTNQGTLLGVYDVRYNNSADLQEHVDIGLSRSTNGGQSWEKMRIPMSFGEQDGLPKGQNGVGDPAILVDTETGYIWIVAAWTHGIGGQRAWTHSAQGMDKWQTAQLMMVKSEDDGKTWSEPMNVTNQLKDPSWFNFCHLCFRRIGSSMLV